MDLKPLSYHDSLLPPKIKRHKDLQIPSFTIESGGNIFGRSSPHLGYSWSYISYANESKRILSLMVYLEEHCLHILKNEEFLLDAVTAYMHGQSELLKSLYQYWRPITEASAILYFLENVQEGGKIGKSVNNFLKLREPSHKKIADKLFQLRKNLKSIYKRRNEILEGNPDSSLSDLIKYLRLYTGLGDMDQNMIRPIRAYQLQHSIPSPSDALDQFLDAVSKVKTKDVDRLRVFLKKSLINPEYTRITEASEVVLKLSLVNGCLSNNVSIASRSMRVLMSLYAGTTSFLVLPEHESILHFDPVSSWIINNPYIGMPILFLSRKSLIQKISDAKDYINSFYSEEPDLHDREIARLDYLEKTLFSNNSHNQDQLQNATITIIRAIIKEIVQIQSYFAKEQDLGYVKQLANNSAFLDTTLGLSAHNALKLLKTKLNLELLKNKLMKLVLRLSILESRSKDFKQFLKDMDEGTEWMGVNPSKLRVIHVGVGGRDLAGLYSSLHDDSITAPMA